VYPGTAWDELIDAADEVEIIAIINPNSGPLSSVDSNYATYMTKFETAGIKMIGYVHTSFGTRAIADVQTDIDTWASTYPLITGIFLDEAASDSSEISYYTQVYQYVMSKTGYDQSIMNPGVEPDPGYLSISTSIVIFENFGSDLPTTTFSSTITCAPNESEKVGYKYKFSAIAHTTAVADMESYLSIMSNDGIGLVYVTDGLSGCCTYNALVSYFSTEASTLSSLN